MKRKSQARNSNANPLSALSLGHGKRTRLFNLLHGHGPANGTLMVLPLDQGLEHGPSDFFPNPAALDTDREFQSKWASKGAAPWKAFQAAIERNLPETMSDRNDRAYHLVIRALDERYGKDQWKKEKRPSKSGGGETTWIGQLCEALPAPSINFTSRSILFQNPMAWSSL